MSRRRTISLFALVSVVASLLVVSSGASADHTAEPTAVTVAGSLQDELGCSADWLADCPETQLSSDAEDGLWQAEFTVPAGEWEYKATLNDAWDENYGAGAVAGGANIALS
ncbi:MAG: DUF3372 domain-containing protein, partial [Acidimicrobiia bacterium]|nr:DUF3372 domain-containing protein [Acidimicrobiia bacterium]